MTKAYRSKALAALHETMSDLHSNGGLSDAKMRDFDAICLSEPPVTSGGRRVKGLAFQVIREPDGTWKWHLVDSRQRVVGHSAISYPTKAQALQAIDALKAAPLSGKAA